MRCMEALGEWGQLADVVKHHWQRLTDPERQRMARMASAAEWGLGRFDQMKQYVSLIPKDSQVS